MKSRIFLIAVTILMTSLFSNLSAQNKKEDIYSISKFQQVQISYDMKDMVTIEYLDALADGPWKMKVRIYEESGKLLYTRMLREKGNSRIGYDISQLPSGNYTFELYKKNQLVCSKPIVKQESIAKTNKESNLKTNLAKFQQVQISYDMKNLVTIEYLDALAQDPWKMKVQIYEESGKLLYTRILRKKGNSKIAYDISQLPSGNYTFELYKNRELVSSKPIMKQESIANKDSNLINQEDSTTELLSGN